MEKRLSRIELLFSLGFLFMLVFAVGAFFYGVKIGSDKTEARYVEQTKHLNSGNSSSAIAYQQQDLVSFYHTVYLPYREFQIEWSQTMNKLSTGKLTDASSALKQLSSLAKQKYTEVERAAQPKSSPLLGQAQIELMKGLKLFEKASNQMISSANKLSGSTVMSKLSKDEYYIEGAKQALSGQANYYTAMLKWSSSIDSNIPSNYELQPVMQISQWKTLQLTVKNKLISDQLNARKQMTAFLPQDLTARVDEFILSGQAVKMKMKTVQSIIDLLIDTKAVRSGDFNNSKARLYSEELLPQLPFFFSDQD